jgi:alkaline phosphatase
MRLDAFGQYPAAALAALALFSADAAHALSITRLTPPSNLFSSGIAAPVTARFIAGQRFDLQATVKPDAGGTITDVQFAVDGVPVAGAAQGVTTSGLTAGAAGSAVFTERAYEDARLAPGVHTLTATATQTLNGVTSTTTATGNFEIVALDGGRRVKNIIILLGDGMGASHRTAARIALNGYAQGKAKAKLAMDTFPNTAMIMTASLDTIITDSAPGMQNYVTGQKAASGQEGVWPDDTTDPFDNPRFEYLSEFLARTQGKKLGLVTTADVFDATPAANAIHTANRGAGTGIVDQYLDDTDRTGLTVLMGGGRKWFLPNSVSGSGRAAGSDYVLPTDLVSGWQVAAGAIDPSRDLINGAGGFVSRGFKYVSDKASMDAAGRPSKLLGLFALSNMNVAYDKINGRRGTSGVVNDYGFPNQPLLEEMTSKALSVLDANSPRGFVLMVEGASIDKQAHEMDSARWMMDTMEFDKAVAVAKEYARRHSDTLVIVTADHECAGAIIIGTSKKTDAGLSASIAAGGNATGGAGNTNGLGAPKLRDDVVANYNGNPVSNFPAYTIATDGYPVSMDPDYKLLIGYGANGDRYENYKARPQPSTDGQQPFAAVSPLSTYPRNNGYDAAATRPFQQSDGFFITGQVPGTTAVHSGSDIPLSAYGRGSELFAGTLDNTDVFFLLARLAAGDRWGY